MKLKKLLYGVATFVPGVNRLHPYGTGGTDSARYCYSIWLRHLIMAQNHGLNTHPRVVAELGPGDSIGIGLAALICGSDKYLAFDVVEHTTLERNLAVFDELVAMFKNKTAVPGDDEWPNVTPKLDDYRFPSHILDDSRLSNALEETRIDRIRKSIKDCRKKDSVIVYKVPWYKKDVIDENCVDMIYSQAVLEHVDDLTGTYAAMHSWLKPDGYMSHVIDFKSHGTADTWNGHWLYSDFTWTLIRGRRPYLLNREPYSTHIELMRRHGFEIVWDQRSRAESSCTLDEVAPRFRGMPAEDLTTNGTFIQAVRNPASDS